MATTLSMAHRDPMRAIIFLATLTLQLTDVGTNAADNRFLLSLLQERMQAEASMPQRSATLKNFKTFSCTARRDGSYPDLASGCSVYYRCLGGAAYSYSCLSGEALDNASGTCRPVAEVNCPRLPPSTPACLNQTNGYYPDYSQGCRSYYRCNNGNMTGRWFCDNSGVWDVATGSCGSGPSLTCNPPSCWGLPDGPHPAPASSCTAYFTCQGGVRTDHVCPYGAIFDYSLRRCVPSSSSVCYEQACEGRVNGFYAAPHASCSAFYECFNGNLIKLQECPRHQIFDGERCITASNFSCWGEGRGSCDGRDDGFYTASESDCRGFFLCRHQQFIRAFLCSHGKVFNGRECVEDQNAICASRPRLPDCSNKIDGYYTVEKSNCRTFFFCRGGAMMSEHTCPGANVFNGEQCVDPVLYQCPGRPPLTHHSGNFTNRVDRVARDVGSDADCSSRPNGYYLDITSQCTRFYYCHAGVKDFTKSCPVGERFNGVRCVSQDTYKCPVMADAPECRVKGDGVYQDLESDCSAYYQCISGVKIEFRCPEGQLHNGRVCKPASQVHCPPSTLCYHRQNGTFVDTDQQCQAYFRCDADVLLWYRACDQGQVFNGKACVPHFFYTCPTHLSTTCVAKGDGAYQDLSTGCHTYYLCRGGEHVSTHNCPEGMVFNGESCVLSTSYVCPGDDVQECGTTQRGFFQDVESGCRRYYYCYNGQKFPRECPEEQVFNGRTCVPEARYKCPSRTKGEVATCNGLDGYYPDLQTSCRSFYYCRGGHRINYTCPDGEAFNGVECVSEEAFTCPTAASCSGRINGFYQDILSGCHKFFYCYDGVKYERSCPSRQVHNGRTCVPASTYTCPNPTDDRDCIGKVSGLYPDLLSRCQVYYKCHQGVKTQTYTCSHSNVFNGHKCVPFYEFSCSSLNEVSGPSLLRLDIPPLQLLEETPNTKVTTGTFGTSGAGIVRPPLGIESEDRFNTDQKIYDSDPITTLTAASSIFSCASLPDGSYTDVNSGCETFLECVQGGSRWTRCPPGNLFSPISRRCESKNLITCPTNNPCEELPDGVHGEPESSCRVFYTCRDRRMYLVSACPEGMAFDQRKGECAPQSLVVCPRESLIPSSVP